MHVLAGIITSTPLFLWAVIVPAALVLEVLYIHEPMQPLRNTLLNVSNGFVVCVSIFVLTPFTSLIAYAATNWLGHGFFDLRLFPHDDAVSQIINGILFVFIYDLFFYFWHKAEHLIPALWDIHAVHHSEKSMNATTYVRQHWLEMPLQNLFISLPIMLIFKLTPITMVIVTVVIMFHLFFTHMNLRLQFGRYSWLITGPQLHRLHHSCLPQHLDSNYAQVFPVIDKIFGTYVAPHWNEFPPTGLASNESIQTLPSVIIWPFKKWFYKINNRAKA